MKEQVFRHDMTQVNAITLDQSFILGKTYSQCFNMLSIGILKSSTNILMILLEEEKGWNQLLAEKLYSLHHRLK